MSGHLTSVTDNNRRICLCDPTRIHSEKYWSQHKSKCAAYRQNFDSKRVFLRQYQSVIRPREELASLGSTSGLIEQDTAQEAELVDSFPCTAYTMFSIIDTFYLNTIGT
jgi:hypothetical protein